MFSLIFRGGIFLFSLILPTKSSFSLSVRILFCVVIITIQFIGLIFGLQSRKNYKKAVNKESRNSILKLGKVFGLMGIVVNSIAMGYSAAILPMLIYIFQ